VRMIAHRNATKSVEVQVRSTSPEIKDRVWPYLMERPQRRNIRGVPLAAAVDLRRSSMSFESRGQTGCSGGSLMKSASVYRRADGWYLSAMSRSTVGLWMATSPFGRLSTEERLTVVGEAVLRALQASQQDLAHPTRFDQVFEPMLALAGVTSWAKFMRGASNVSVDDDGEWLNLEPSRNQGPRDGYTPLLERTFRIAHDSTPEAIGQAVQQAIARCE
jgi:hypothetical protein